MPDTNVRTDTEILAQIGNRRMRCEGRLLWPWEFRRKGSFIAGADDGHACWRPAYARVLVTCGACGASYRLFLCRLCTTRFRDGGKGIGCRSCHREGAVRGSGS